MWWRRCGGDGSGVAVEVVRCGLMGRVGMCEWVVVVCGGESLLWCYGEGGGGSGCGDSVVRKCGSEAVICGGDSGDMLHVVVVTVWWRGAVV